MRRRLGAFGLAGTERQLSGTSNSTPAAADFVALYYKLYWAQGSEEALPADDADAVALDSSVPDDVAERLSAFSLSFGSLPPLLQRAVLWDAGYVPSASGDGELVTIRTDCERALTMAEIALSADEMAGAGCASLTCSTTSSLSSGSWSTSQECESIERLESLVKCAAASIGAKASTNTSSSIWSTGKGTLMKREAAPHLSVYGHSAAAASTYSILSIHSTSGLVQANAAGPNATPDQVCAAASTLVIPCVPYASSSSARWCRPDHSPLLTRWLSEYSEQLDLDTTVRTEVTAYSGSGSNNSSSSNVVSQQDESGVVVNPGFLFDGHSSDLAQQFYRRHLAGDQLDPLKLSVLPEEVEERLQSVGLQFADLPSLLQRALLWDSGYALTDDGALVQVFAECGHDMSDLMLSTSDVQDAGCVTQTCSSSPSNQGHGSSQLWRRGARCTSYQTLASSSRCAVVVGDGDGSIDTASSSAKLGAIWANGARDDTVPNVVVRRWLDNNQSQIFALQLVDSNTADEGTDGSCASIPEMVVPCVDAAVASADKWCRPAPGDLVTSWLQHVTQPDQGSSSPSPVWYAVAIPVAIIVMLILAAFGLRYRSVILYRVFIRGRRSTELGRTLRHTDKASSSATVLTPESTGLPSPEAEFLGAFSDTFPVMAPNVEFGISNGRSRGWMDRISSMKQLLENPYVCDSIITFQDLKFHHLVGRGLCGEVWLCMLHDQCVAAKRLLKRRRKCTPGILEAFTNEILLTASLRHPNIVRFLGVASSTLHNLWLVTEYLENGDLHDCLQSFGSQLSWKREKLQIAIGVTRGLCYLHSDVSPAVIHRDLKTRNVLLTSSLEPKLADFGASHRRRSSDDDDRSRTASDKSERSRGTETPYWSAPEVLQSREYSEKADMYSLGVLLCELDALTCPFSDAAGASLPLQRIADELAKPKLSAECPPTVAELVASCLEREPSRRPSAVDALDVLDALTGPVLDTFSF